MTTPDKIWHAMTPEQKLRAIKSMNRRERRKYCRDHKLPMVYGSQEPSVNEE